MLPQLLFHPHLNFTLTCHRYPQFVNRLLSSLMTVQFPYFRPSGFFLFKPFIFGLLDRPVRSFWTVHFEHFGPSTFIFHDVQFSSFGPSSFFLSNRPLFDFRTIHFESFGPITFAQDLPLSVVWTVQFNPPELSSLTQDRPL